MFKLNLFEYITSIFLQLIIYLKSNQKRDSVVTPDDQQQQSSTPTPNTRTSSSSFQSYISGSISDKNGSKKSLKILFNNNGYYKSLVFIIILKLFLYYKQ